MIRMFLKKGVANVGCRRWREGESGCVYLRWNEDRMDGVVYGSWFVVDSSASDVASGLSGWTVMLASKISLETSNASVREFLEPGAPERVLS